LDWLLEGGDPQGGAQLAAASTWFWTREGMLDEAARWMQKARAVPIQDVTVRAAVLHGSGRIAAPLGDLSAAREACAASIELSRSLDDDAALGRALITLGLCEWALGDLSAAAGTHDEAAARAEASGDRWHRDVALVLRLRTAIDACEPDAEQRLDSVLSTLGSGGDPQVVGLALGQQARLGLMSGDADRASATAQASLKHWRSVGYREGELQAMNLTARASVLAGHLDQAAGAARSAVLLAVSMGHRGGLFEGLETLATIHHAAGRDDEAWELISVADRERERTAIPVPAGDRTAIDELRRSVTDRRRLDGGRSAARLRDLQQIVADLRDDT
jgi:hypothetical protein